METIWDFTYMVLLAAGMFLTGVYAKRALSLYKRLFVRRKRINEMIIAFAKADAEFERRIEQLEMRVELHTKKDSVYLNKFDELEAKLKERDSGRKAKVKQEVVAYLNELKK